MSDKKHPEYQYLDLVQEILEKGSKQVDAQSKDVTYSLFGKQMRYDLSEGLPLLTTKKVYWKGYCTSCTGSCLVKRISNT